MKSLSSIFLTLLSLVGANPSTNKIESFRKNIRGSENIDLHKISRREKRAIMIFQRQPVEEKPSNSNNASSSDSSSTTSLSSSIPPASTTETSADGNDSEEGNSDDNEDDQGDQPIVRDDSGDENDEELTMMTKSNSSRSSIVSNMLKQSSEVTQRDQCFERIVCEGLLRSVPQMILKMMTQNRQPKSSESRASQKLTKRKNLAEYALGKITNVDRLPTKPPPLGGGSSTTPPFNVINVDGGAFLPLRLPVAIPNINFIQLETTTANSAASNGPATRKPDTSSGGGGGSVATAYLPALSPVPVASASLIQRQNCAKYYKCSLM